MKYYDWSKRDWLGIELSLEIFRQSDTQKRISRAKEDIKKGRVKSFDSAEDAVRWLEKYN